MTNPSTTKSRSMAAIVPRTRGSVGRQEADLRNQQQARVDFGGAVVLHERVARRDRSPWRRCRRGSARAACASARPGRGGRISRCRWIARSNATQAMTFECVKWRFSPRVSQMPWSGLFQCLLEELDDRRPRSATRPRSRSSPAAAGDGTRHRSARRRRRAEAESDAALPMRTGAESS